MLQNERLWGKHFNKLINLNKVQKKNSHMALYRNKCFSYLFSSFLMGRNIPSPKSQKIQYD